MRYAGRVLHHELRSAWFSSGRGLAAAAAFVNAEVALRRATIDVTVGKLPQHWGFLVCCGVAPVVRSIERIAPDAAEIQAAEQCGCISPALARLLSGASCAVDVNVPSEGTLLFAGDTLATVEGPLWQAWILAEVARNTLLASSCVATRATRLVLAAKGTTVVDGSSWLAADHEQALSIARAAAAGGVAFTQSPVACVGLGIPLRASPSSDALALVGSGEATRGSGWNFTQYTQDVLMHLGPGDDEEETLSEMHRLGVRSGGWVARGLAHAAVGLEARIDIVALEQGGIWLPRLGAVPDITAVPGRKLLIRYLDGKGRPIADIMHGVGERIQPANQIVIVGYLQTGIPVPIEGAESGVPLLSSVIRNGTRAGPDEDLAVARERVRTGLLSLAEPYKRLRHPAAYPVGMAPAVAQLKEDLLKEVC
jgi:nicotinate phosphoribosyltransferase